MTAKEYLNQAYMLNELINSDAEVSLLKQADTKQLSGNGKKQPRIVARLMGANWEEHSRVNLPIDQLAISFSTTKATI